MLWRLKEGDKMEKEETAKIVETGTKKKNLLIEENLNKLVLGSPLNRYDLILLSRRWAYELKSKDGETRSLQELIQVAIRDIVTNSVNHKMVRELPPFRGYKKQKNAHEDMLKALHQIPSESSKKE